MKRRLKKLLYCTPLNSLRFRISFIVFLAMFMLTIFLVCNNAYAIAVVRDNVFDANAQMMDMYMHQIDDSLDAMENYWAGMQSSSDMFTLIKRDEKRPLDYYKAESRLMSDMSNVVQTYRFIDFLFIYYTEMNTYRDAAKYMIDSGERRLVRKVVMEEIQRSIEAGKVSAQWKCVEADKEYYLIRTFRYLGIYMGGCINVSRLVQSIRSDGFTNADYLTFYENGGKEMGHVLPRMDMGLSVDETARRFSQNIDGNRYLIITHPAESGDYSMVALIRDKSILEGLGALQKIIIILGICLIMFFFLFVSICRQWILRPVLRLCEAMNRLKSGDFTIRLGKAGNCEEFNLMYDTFDEMTENIEALKIDVYEQKVQRQKADLQYQKAKLMQQKAELQYMKLQTKPHYYINCLNVIHNLSIMNKNELIRDMTTYLGNQLRYTMEGTTVDTLKKEVDYVHNYMHIQELRFADSLTAYIEVDASIEHVLVPPLIIQTFVENTVKYQMVAGGHTEIYVVASRCEPPHTDRIRIEIWDTGEGFTEEIMALLNKGEKIIDEKGEHYGIRNVLMRMRLIYEGRESAEFKNHWETGGAYIILELPDDGGKKLTEDII